MIDQISDVCGLFGAARRIGVSQLDLMRRYRSPARLATMHIKVALNRPAS